jgi:GDP-L-fucose synthase
MDNMKKVLVTGGSGLVGSAIQFVSLEQPFCSQYEFIFIKSRDFDLSDMEQTKSMFAKYNPEIVIHLAACVGGLFKNMNHKVEMLERNLMINYNVVKCSHEYGVEKLVACLSTCIFPDRTSYPINESMLHDGPPHTSNDAYAYAKRMLEIHCQAYRENYGSNFVCVIPTNIYGPHDNYSLEDGHVIPSLIHKCYQAKLANESFVVRGTGAPLRQFIYSVDLAKLILWSLKKVNRENIILSVSEIQEVTIEYVARLIARSFNYESRMVFDDSFADGQYKKTADNGKLMNLLNCEFEFTTIENGIKSSVDWFIEHYDDARK